MPSEHSRNDPAIVLIVDDEPLVRWALRAGLERHGYRVLEAGSGQEALASTSTLGPDVGVLDWRLPDTDGLALMSALRARWPDCRVILLTAFASEECSEAARRGGAACVVGEPFDVENLVSRIAAEVPLS